MQEQLSMWQWSSPSHPALASLMAQPKLYQPAERGLPGYSTLSTLVRPARRRALLRAARSCPHCLRAGAASCSQAVSVRWSAACRLASQDRRCRPE